MFGRWCCATGQRCAARGSRTVLCRSHCAESQILRMPTLPISLSHKSDNVSLARKVRAQLTRFWIITIGKLFLFGLNCGCKVEGVEDAAGVPTFIWRQAVLFEDGILVNASWVLNILPPSYLDVMEQYELDHKEGWWRRKVFCFASIIPLRSIDDSNLCENFWQ